VRKIDVHGSFAVKVSELIVDNTFRRNAVVDLIVILRCAVFLVGVSSLNIVLGSVVVSYALIKRGTKPLGISITAGIRRVTNRFQMGSATEHVYVRRD
jgi:hypothetical protein